MKMAIIVPTCRPQQIESFLLSWSSLARKHSAEIYVVHDEMSGLFRVVRHFDNGATEKRHLDACFKPLIFTQTDSVRNAGFVAAIEDGAEVIITLDDDVVPPLGGDPIMQHLLALQKRVPISWFQPTDNPMRGMPYGVRSEAQVRVSHGIWTVDPDFDSVTRISGRHWPEKFPYRGPIPKGCLTPLSGMNLAFHRSVAPLVYFAPMGPRTPFNRFGDIWMGVHLKRALDERNEAIYHGASSVEHHRSDDFEALEQEAAGIKAHNDLHNPDQAFALEKAAIHSKYWGMYQAQRSKWEKLMKALI